ncbi:MAG: FecR family protein [Cytophagaceae bacterium]|nr:FecR family protein [Cytophagaceae bacterium]
MTPIPITPQLLDRYLAGSCSPTEVQHVEAWYHDLSGETDALSQRPAAERLALETETLTRIRAEIARRETIALGEAPRRWRLWPGRVAAALVVLVLSWVLYEQVRPKSSGYPESASQRRAENPVVRFVNVQGSLVRHRLPDGTLVWLHPQAELRYPRVFGPHRRAIAFAGEAYFDVVRDEARPFLIQCGTMRVRVLGTRFNVVALPRQALYEVAVVSGSVAVSTPERAASARLRTVVLKPKQQALFEVTTHRLLMNEVRAQPLKKLYEPVSVAFNDTPIREVVRQLERRFDVTMRVGNQALYDCQLTADFNQQPLPVILELLCESLDATYTISGGTILLEGSGCD